MSKKFPTNPKTEELVTEVSNLPDIPSEDLKNIRLNIFECSQRDMAELIGMDPSSYGHLERGKAGYSLNRPKSILLHLLMHYYEYGFKKSVVKRLIDA